MYMEGQKNWKGGIFGNLLFTFAFWFSLQYYPGYTQFWWIFRMSTIWYGSFKARPSQLSPGRTRWIQVSGQSLSTAAPLASAAVCRVLSFFVSLWIDSLTGLTSQIVMNERVICNYVVFPVTVTLISCKYTETLEKGRGNPVYLGLKEPELCLFCTKVKGQPVLQLQVSMENKGLVYAWLGVKVKVLVAQLCPTLPPHGL